MKKRLLKSDNKMLAGVCAGIAEYLDLDPTVIRLVWVLFSVFSAGGGLLAYLICLFVIPNKPSNIIDVN